MDINTLNKRVWEEMVYANMRANYFGDLVGTYQNWDKWMRAGALVLTSGSVATLASDIEPLKWAVSIAATALSLWLFLSQYSTLSRDANDLTMSWQAIASRYERLWNHLEQPDAEEIFDKIFEDEGALSRQGAKFPQRDKSLNYWQDQAEKILTERYKCV
jgi:hypothetical protein